MKIKDMTFTYDGELQITNDLLLMNPEFKIVAVRCDLRTNQASLIVEFNERGGIFKHGIEYDFQASEDTGVTKQDLIKVVSENIVLSKFTLLPPL